MPILKMYNLFFFTEVNSFFYNILAIQQIIWVSIITLIFLGQLTDWYYFSVKKFSN